MSMNLVTPLYLIASVCFIQALKGLSHPTTSRHGNVYGMLGMALAILEAFKAKTIIVNKRSMASGYAGLDNELFYLDKNMMAFGDAKKVIEDMVKAVE
jgi:NAD/NADP transhydrogenase beta subunit